VLSQNGTATEGHIIRDGEFNYTWGSFSPQGIKVKVTSENKNSLIDDKSGALIDNSVNYKCNDWRVDSSKFELPSGVEFMDISGQMEAMQDAAGGIEESQCSACNQAPDEVSKQQCLQALGC